MQKFFLPSKIFTGDEWLKDHAIITKDGVIEKFIPQSQVNASEAIENYTQCDFVPPFIDAQVYGAGKRLFAAYPDVETLQLMNKIFRSQGTVLFVPTIATNTIELFKKCIDAVRDYWKQGEKGVHGLHLEGPWIHPSKRGAHVEEWIHPPTIKEAKEILDYGEGVITMITVAPEVCSDDVIQLIRSRGIVISAGHSNANYFEAMNSFDKGVSAVTHLYNAMSPLHHREPGLVGAAFQHAEVMSSVIPDGHHVDFAAISIAKKLMKERLFAITDAVTETTAGPYQHYLAGDKYECNGILSGSAISMHQAFLNLVNKVGVGVAEALRMCSLYPAKALRYDEDYGKIAPGRRGQFLVLDKQLGIVDLITL
ncbi:MAG: N-acetylglucosamine-6-phosphate deacetylase [Flavisolibacter sp.]